MTPEGEKFLDENRDLMEDIFERVRGTVRDFAGGSMGELNGAFMHLAGTTFKRAWRLGPDHPSIKRVTEILRKTAEEIEREWQSASQRTEV